MWGLGTNALNRFLDREIVPYIAKNKTLTVNINKTLGLFFLESILSIPFVISSKLLCMTLITVLIKTAANFQSLKSHDTSI